MNMASPFRKRQAAAEVERRRNKEETYTKPLLAKQEAGRGKAPSGEPPQTDEDVADVKTFLKDFYKKIYTKERKQQLENLLEEHPDTLGQHYKNLVPTKCVPHEEFWQRYEYRCDPDRIMKEWERRPETGRQARAASIAGGMRNMLGGGGGGSSGSKKKHQERNNGGKGTEEDMRKSNGNVIPEKKSLSTSSTSVATTETSKGEPTTTTAVPPAATSSSYKAPPPTIAAIPPPVNVAASSSSSAKTPPAPNVASSSSGKPDPESPQLANIKAQWDAKRDIAPGKVSNLAAALFEKTNEGQKTVNNSQINGSTKKSSSSVSGSRLGGTTKNEKKKVAATPTSLDTERSRRENQKRNNNVGISAAKQQSEPRRSNNNGPSVNSRADGLMRRTKSGGSRGEQGGKNHQHHARGTGNNGGGGWKHGGRRGGGTSNGGGAEPHKSAPVNKQSHSKLTEQQPIGAQKKATNVLIALFVALIATDYIRRLMPMDAICTSRAMGNFGHYVSSRAVNIMCGRRVSAKAMVVVDMDSGDMAPSGGRTGVNRGRTNRKGNRYSNRHSDDDDNYYHGGGGDYRDDEDVGQRQRNTMNSWRQVAERSALQSYGGGMQNSGWNDGAISMGNSKYGENRGGGGRERGGGILGFFRNRRQPRHMVVEQHVVHHHVHHVVHESGDEQPW